MLCLNHTGQNYPPVISNDLKNNDNKWISLFIIVVRLNEFSTSENRQSKKKMIDSEGT